MAHEQTVTSWKQVPDVLLKHVVEERLSGASEDELFQKMRRGGVSTSLARCALAGALEYVAEHNSRISRQLDRYEQIFAIFSKLANNSRAEIDTLPSFPGRAFLTRYYTRNAPFVVRAGAVRTRAFAKWTFAFLAEKYGDVPVKAAIGRNGYADPEGNLAKLQKTIAFGDFLQLVVATEGNDAYMVARNHNFMEPRMRPLLEDLHPLPHFIQRPPSPRQTHLWIGPKGTVTPFHFDRRNILFLQIRGSKRFSLASPLSAPYVYNHYSVFSEVDPEQPDLEKHPLFRHVHLHTVDLSEGDALFLPVGWWHQVTSLAPSISVGTSDFRYDNEFDVKT